MSSPGRPGAHGLPAVLALALAADVTLTIASADQAPTLPAAAVIAPAATARPADWMARAPQVEATDLAGLLQQRLEKEAVRAAPRLAEAAAVDDDLASMDRARQAERIVRRGVRGALSTQLETLARENPALGGALRWVEDFGGRPSWRASPAAPAPVASPEPGAAPGASGATTRDLFSAGAGLRLDAHPRVELRARAGSLTGTIELPLLDREIRVGLEQPLGRIGRATLRGGRSEERGDWADAAVVLRF